MSVRLFVGGLPPGLTPEELRARFTPFGEVLDCRIAPPKVYGGGASSKGAGTPPATFPRDFGHVELLPKDEAALRKCISAYNGCRWRGGVLRCAPARPDYAQRLARERGGAAGDEASAEQHALPPLAPGCVLRLRPPKTSAAVEVTLGSGSRVESFPPAPAAAGAPLSWEPLQAPPRSGYRFEEHLQRIAADLPPELLEAVEARRRRGRALAEARAQQAHAAAGVEVAYAYSEGDSESLQLESDDDAATAAAAVAAAVSSRERRTAAAAAGPAGARQQPKEGRHRQQERLRVIDFLAAEGPQEQPASGRRAAADADLSRFDSDSDAEWEGPPAGATHAAAAAGVSPLPRQPAARQAVADKREGKAATQPQQEQQNRQPVPQALPADSSGSSGGSELEEWLAAEGAGAPGDSDSTAEGTDPEASGGEEEMPDSDAEKAAGVLEEEEEEQEDGVTADSSGSSGGSELEEWLATEGGGSPGDSDSEGEEGKEEEAGEGAAAAHQAAATAPAARKQEGRQAEAQRAQRAQQPVVDFLQEGEAAAGRHWWQKLPPAVDLSRFASSSEDEGEPQPQRQGLKRQRQERAIPQADGAGDSSSEESSSSDEEESEEEQEAGSGGGDASASSDSDSGSSEEEESSTSEDSGSASEEEEEEAEKGAGGAADGKQEPGGLAAAQSGSDSGASEDAGEDAAAAAAEQEQAALAVLFPEGAAFRRAEPLPQIEASWRANRETWMQDYRQKHRQALRLVGRSSGGGSKRQRKG